MILYYIADSTGLIIKGTSTLDAEIFRHGDLNALNVTAVPERLHEGIGEAEDNHVMYRSLTKIMVDAEDILLIEGAEKDLVQAACRVKITSERLFDDDPGTLCAA